MQGRVNKETIQNTLYQITIFLFEKQISQSKILSRLAQVSNHKEYKQTTSILFSLYNLIVINNVKMAYQCIQKTQQHSQYNNVASIVSLVLKSVLLAEMKQHKDSLLFLNKAFDMCQKDDTDSELMSVYQIILIKLIQIHDMNTFKKQFLSFLESISDKFSSQENEIDILKAIESRKRELKKKVCAITSKTKLLPVSMKVQKSILTSKDSDRGSLKSAALSRDKSSRSNPYSPRSKLNRNLKKVRYINPYNLEGMMQTDNCVFM